MQPMRNTWVPLSEVTVLEAPILKIVRQRCAAGTLESDFLILRSRDWVNLVPITADGKAVLVRQYRFGTAQQALELPGGICDPEDATPLQSALRELAEETGFEPEPGALIRDLGWIHPNPAILDNRCHLFAVGPVRRTREQELDPHERIEVVVEPIAELVKQVREGAISHALMRNAFLSLLLDDASGPALLQRQLEAFTGVQRPVQK